MKKVIKQWLALTLAIGALVSCSEERNEPSSTAEGGGETVTLSLSAEVSVEDSGLRAIDYKLGENAKGQLVPMPQFEDGQEVDVHTIVKSSRGIAVAKTLKWRYNAGSKKLVLSPEDGHSITVSGFNNDGGVKWYISGLIGGTLTGTKVSFEGTRELQGVEGNVGDIVGSLNVPYAFPWTEVTIDTSNSRNTRESNGSYKYAQIPASSNVKFSPQGSLIAYKLGTNQRAGAYTFTPSGFSVSSNSFGDKGTFELNTSLPTNSTPTVLPSWSEGTPSALVYSFASGHAPGTIAHEQTADKTYYAWVMPHTTKPASVLTSVTIKGESSRPETATYRDYTKTWFTDYSVKGTELRHGRVYSLSANVTHTYRLPIEYVTDYNLAGGEGLTYSLSNVSPQPMGVQGPLRLANFNADGSPNNHGHRTDMSGYYNWYKVAGVYNSTYNPDTKNLQAEVDAAFGPGKYYVPTIDQLWALTPSYHETQWSGPSIGDNGYEVNDVDDAIAFGSPDALIRRSYRAEYSIPMTSTGGADTWNNSSHVYAIRFKSRASNPNPMLYNFDDPATNGTKKVSYPSALDNSLKCAYRFVRLGRYNEWQISGKISSFLGVRIDVVYLGEEIVPTELSTISNEQWWADKQAQGLVISKTLPAVQWVYGVSSPTVALHPLNGFALTYFAPNPRNSNNGYTVTGYASGYTGSNGIPREYGGTIRLFRNLDF